MSSGYIAQWLERLTADQQVPGSNPGVPFSEALRAFGHETRNRNAWTVDKANCNHLLP